MARIVFTTCGTSVLQSACWQIDGVKLESLCGAEGAGLREKIARNEKKISAFREIHHEAQSLADTVDTNLLKEENIGRMRDLPAEVASLVAMNYLLSKTQPRRRLQSKDIVYLLHSTDEQGHYCTNVVECVLNSCFQNTVTVCPEAIGEVSPSDFKATMGVMSERCRAIITGNPGYEFIFNLTGGYKAMGITASALGTALHDAANVRVCYLHETTDYSRISTGVFREDGIRWIDWDMFRAYSSVTDPFESH